jgi:hypothetical protein
VPNDILRRGGRGGNFIPPLVRDWLLKDNLLNDPLPPFFGRVSKERGDLWPPLMSRVKENMSKFPNEQVELSFVATSSKPIYPNMRHPRLHMIMVVVEGSSLMAILDQWIPSGLFFHKVPTLEESLSISTGLATWPLRLMIGKCIKKYQYDCQLEYFS